MLKWLTTRTETRRTAEAIYAAIVAQSRLPVYYADLGVPDTVTGRFEMIVLHMFLALERLQTETGGHATRANRLGQALNEAFVADMDSAMREMGVADIRVSKRMHQTAGAYFGRLMAYRKAFAQALPSTEADALAEAIERNVLAESATHQPAIATHARTLAAYCRAAATQLAQLDFKQMSAGTIAFPVPAASALQERRTPKN